MCRLLASFLLIQSTSLGVSDVTDALKQWAVGMTTAPRRASTLEKSLASLALAGWNTPRLFVEPETTLPTERLSLPITQRDQPLGAFPNWYLGLTELYVRQPDADAYLMCQDDVLFTRGLRNYLGQMLWPAANVGVISLYCPSHEHIVPAMNTVTFRPDLWKSIPVGAPGARWHISFRIRACVRFSVIRKLSIIGIMVPARGSEILIPSSVPGVDEIPFRISCMSPVLRSTLEKRPRSGSGVVSADGGLPFISTRNSRSGRSIPKVAAQVAVRQSIQSCSRRKSLYRKSLIFTFTSTELPASARKERLDEQRRISQRDEAVD